MSAGYTIQAKPTEYRGTVFRSRLEATWAAFFDMIGWRWEYEPFDLAGWVPDFVIRGAYRDVLVEVKPNSEHINEVLPKLLRAAPEGCLLVLGSGPASLHGEGDPRIDHMLSTYIGWAWSPYYAARGSAEWHRLGLNFDATAGIWDAHLDGETYVGFHTGRQIDGDANFSPFGDLRPIWAAATNLTRWKPKS